MHLMHPNYNYCMCECVNHLTKGQDLSYIMSPNHSEQTGSHFFYTPTCTHTLLGKPPLIVRSTSTLDLQQQVSNAGY